MRLQVRGYETEYAFPDPQPLTLLPVFLTHACQAFRFFPPVARVSIATVIPRLQLRLKVVDMLESAQRSFAMNTSSDVTIQLLVFSLVVAAFTTVYITQPVLPVIQHEFAVDPRTASLSISMVILGIALSNLPFGILADRYAIKPILLTGATVVTATSLVCAATQSIALLIAARFIQGLFIPSLTTCLAAYLAKSLPASRLNVVMGSYVSATAAGGMGGRLLGG